MTVDDVEGPSISLRATGERHDYDAGAVVVMTDPEGHELSLVQYYSEESALAANGRVCPEWRSCRDERMSGRLLGCTSDRGREDRG